MAELLPKHVCKTQECRVFLKTITALHTVLNQDHSTYCYSGIGSIELILNLHWSALSCAVSLICVAQAFLVTKSPLFAKTIPAFSKYSHVLNLII